VFELPARGARFARVGYGNEADAKPVQVVLDAGFAVAAVGGDRARCLADAVGDSLEGQPSVPYAGQSSGRDGAL
jgi:hypothetical protein